MTATNMVERTRRRKSERMRRGVFFLSLAICILSLFAMGWLLARPQTTHEQRAVARVESVKTEPNVSVVENETSSVDVEEPPEIETSLDDPIAKYDEETVEASSLDDNQEIANAPIEPAQPAEPRNVVTEVTPTSFQTNVEIRPKKISEAAIGDRTPGVNPEGNDGSDESIFLTQNHCVYSLVLQKENGSFCYVKLLRPDDWLDSEDVQICRNATGQILDDVDFLTDEMLGLELVDDYAYAVWLELPEMECVGWAKVVDVEDFQYAPGIGNLVTGTFKHISDDVIDLVVEGQTKPIGVTNSHQFWSVDREEFVPVGELIQGERLLLFSGDTARVLQKLPRPGPQDVYNIEVFGEHVYLVTHDAILVHNGCFKDKHSHVIYRSINEKEGVYIGRTVDFARRKGEHRRISERTIMKIDELSNLSYKQAQYAEQYLLNTLHDHKIVTSNKIPGMNTKKFEVIENDPELSQIRDNINNIVIPKDFL